jgi:iron-sulfur cluster assembly protein
MIQFTQAAETQLKEAIEPTEIVRVAVQGGGCAGMSYVLNIEDEVDDEDLIIDIAHVKICIDPYSADILEETTIDFVKSLQREGFVFNNPKSNTTCGCGMSFS